MTIAMQGNRIVFAAVVAFTGKRTPDGRVIIAPEGFRCPAREFPLPVYGKNTWHIPVGVIEEAYVVAGRIIAFGRLDTAPEFTPFVSKLRDGTHFLEIDLTDISLSHEDQTTHMVSWKLASACIGDKPCWDLPPVQIEDLIT